MEKIWTSDGIRKNASELCEEIAYSAVPIVASSSGASTTIRDADQLRECSEKLNSVMKEQVNRNLPLWTAPQFRLFRQHVKQQGFSLVLLPPDIQGLYASFNIAVVGKTTLLGLNSPGFFLDENSIFIADHEISHQSDVLEMKEAFSDSQDLFDKSNLDQAQMAKKLNYYLDYSRAGLNYEEREEFDALRQQIFGDIFLYSMDELAEIGIVLYEVFRYAHENHDERLKNYVFSKDFFPFKKNREMGCLGYEVNGNKVDLKKPVIMARLIEAGLWEDFMKSPDFDPDKIKDVNEDLILFFRLAIRGVDLVKR